MLWSAELFVLWLTPVRASHRFFLADWSASNKASLLPFKGKVLYSRYRLIQLKRILFLQSSMLLPILQPIWWRRKALFLNRPDNSLLLIKALSHGWRICPGDVHINAAESFNAMPERAKTAVFHYMSPKHLSRYLTELSFRWSNRDPKEVVTKKGKKKLIWKPKPIMQQLTSLLPFAYDAQLRWQRTGAVRQIVTNSSWLN